MNLLAISIIFGLVYPVYKSIASFLMGNSNPDVKNARTEYVNELPDRPRYALLRADGNFVKGV